MLRIVRNRSYMFMSWLTRVPLPACFRKRKAPLTNNEDQRPTPPQLLDTGANLQFCLLHRIIHDLLILRNLPVPHEGFRGNSQINPNPDLERLGLSPDLPRLLSKCIHGKSIYCQHSGVWSIHLHNGYSSSHWYIHIWYWNAAALVLSFCAHFYVLESYTIYYNEVCWVYVLFTYLYGYKR